MCVHIYYAYNRHTSYTYCIMYNVLCCASSLSHVLTLCDSMDCSLPGSSVHGDSPDENTGVDCHALLQGIFPTQGLNLGLLHCRQILYHLSHEGIPIYNRICMYDAHIHILYIYYTHIIHTFHIYISYWFFLSGDI